MPSSHHARSPRCQMVSGSVKRARGFTSPAHASDPVNQPIRVREKENEGEGVESGKRKE